MALDAKTQAALKQYGYLGTLAASVPDLAKLLQQAISGSWSNDEFSRNLQDSHWWKSNRDSVKQNLILKATKPGEWNAKSGEMDNKASMIAAELGVTLTGGAHGTLRQITNAALSLGWDETRLRQEIGSHWSYQKGHEAAGTAGQITQKLRAQSAALGIQTSPTSVANATWRILTGKSTLESYQASTLQAAKGKYAAFADQLDQGLTMHDIAEPYRQSMASLLEIAPEKVDLFDTTIQKALTTRLPRAGNAGSSTQGGSPTPVAMPLWKFEQDLRKDPRRNFTKGAVNEAYDAVRQIGQDWGFA